MEEKKKKQRKQRNPCKTKSRRRLHHKKKKRSSKNNKANNYKAAKGLFPLYKNEENKQETETARGIITTTRLKQEK